MPTIDRRSLVLLLLGIGAEGTRIGGIGGITRLQKFLYLLQEEEGLQPKGDGFEFAAYKAGPYSSKLYDDLELLENLGLLEADVAAEATEPEAAEIELLDFDELIGDEGDTAGGTSTDALGAADAYEERRFTLTDEGKEQVEQLLKSGEYEPVVDGIRRIKSKYGNYSLWDLLRYVYTKYPKMTVESEIKDKVLRRRY